MAGLAVATAFVILVAAGCGTTYTWSHPDFSQERWAQDRHECLYKAALVEFRAYEEIFRTCLEARGWSLVGRK